MTKQKLLEGWKEVKLGNEEYFKILSSGINEFDGEKDYLSTESIKETKINKIECLITYKDKPSRANMQPVLNSVWFAKMQSTLKVYSFNESNKEEIEKYILSTGFVGIKVNEKLVFSEYLRLLLISKEFNKLKDQLCTGSTQKGINNQFIKQISLILPPLPSQKAIVSILEKAEKSKEWRKEADDLTKDFLKSVFLEMFGDSRKNPKKFELKKLKKVADTAMGGTPDPKISEYYIGSNPWMKGPDLHKTFIYEAYNHISDNALTSGRVKKYTSGTVLVGRAGQGKTRGTVAILRINATTNETMIGIIPKKNISNGDYILFNLKNRYSELRAFGGDKNRGGITQANLKEMVIPLPPIELQNKFASIVKEVEAIKEQQKHSKEQINNLFNALMQKAFKGELIYNGR